MKKSVLILSLVSSLFAMDVIKPPFVVENEPIPPAVTIQYGYGSNKFHEEFVDLYPVTIGKNDRFLLYPNLGFMGEQYPVCDSLPDNYSGFYGGFLGSGTVGKSFFWTSYHSIGVFAEEPKNYSEGVKYFQISLFGHKWRPNFATSLGILINSRLGEPFFLPLLKISWATERIVLEGTLPLTASARLKCTENTHLVGSARLKYSNFVSDAAKLDVSRFETMLTGERRIRGWVWGTVGAGYSGETGFSTIHDREIGEIEPGFRAALSIIVRPETESGVREK